MLFNGTLFFPSHFIHTLSYDILSQVSVTSRPGRTTKDANPKIVRRAAMDAEMDIKRKKLDARKKDDELEQIRMKRQRLTNAMNRGELDNRKIDEINKTSIRNRSPSPVRSKRGRNDEGREHRESVHPDEAYRQEKRKFRVDKRGVPQEEENGKTYEAIDMILERTNK